MNRLTALFLVLFLSVPSCASRIPKPPAQPKDGRIHLRIDQNFGQMGIEAIISAIGEWHSVAGLCFDVEVVDVTEEYETWVDDNTTTIYFAAEGTWPYGVFEFVMEKSGINNAIGLTLFTMKDIFLIDGYYSLRQVAMHEIGHALGIMEHNPDRLSTMYHIALSGGIQRVTYKDAMQVIKLHPGNRCQ
jgi:predicted Zn-dependent protease